MEKYTKIILEALGILLVLVSCNGNKEHSHEVLMTGIVTQKYTNSDSFAWSDPDGGGMSILTNKFVILNDKDTFEYRAIYPRQPTLLFRYLRKFGVEVGDTACIISCDRDIILVKKANIQFAMADYQHEHESNWCNFLCSFLLLIVPLVLLMFLKLLAQLFEWEVGDENRVLIVYICILIGVILAYILKKDIQIFSVFTNLFV
jgi:hypothetical protein